MVATRKAEPKRTAKKPTIPPAIPTNDAPIDSRAALIASFYEASQAEMERRADHLTGDTRTRLAFVLHGSLEALRPHKQLLASAAPRLADPLDANNAFSPHTRVLRDRAIAVFYRALDSAFLPAQAHALMARALWLVHTGLIMMFVHDDTDSEARTHALVDDALDLVVPMFPFLGMPMGASFFDRITKMLERAQIM